MVITPETPVRDIAVEFPTAIPVFERLGVDYCCHGQHTLAEACTKQDLALEPVLKELSQFQQQAAKPAKIRVAISEIIEGRNVKDSEQKASELAKDIINAENPVNRWQELMAELDTLVGSQESATLPPAPILSNAGFTTANTGSLRKGLLQETLEKNRFFNIHDQIEFEFKRGTKTDGTENYIPFISASPGQQATCLLETLLAQDGAPLLIDQPEEDLDNEQIQSVSERIMTTKSLRQLIFVSHNANIVVNGDSELVACFKYQNQNDNTSGLISPVGSIDHELVRETITDVMEGGKRAFELRREKYGF